MLGETASRDVNELAASLSIASRNLVRGMGKKVESTSFTHGRPLRVKCRRSSSSLQPTCCKVTYANSHRCSRNQRKRGGTSVTLVAPGKCPVVGDSTSEKFTAAAYCWVVTYARLA